jgi:integrase
VAFVKKRVLADGKKTAYLVRYRAPDGRERSKQFSKRVDADRFANSVETTKAAGTWIDPARGRMTVKSWVAEWQAGRVDLRPSTRARQDGILDGMILPTFGELALVNMEHAAVQAWVNRMTASGLAPATVVKAKQVLGTLLAAAVRDRRLAVNPADGVRLPKVEREEMRCLTPSEVLIVADAIDPRYRAFVFLGAYGGLRLGEMLALRWGRVNLLGRTVVVAENLVEVRGSLLFGEPKTKAARRSVPVPTIVTDALAATTGANPDPDSLVFTSTRGVPLRPGLYRQRVWVPAVKKANLGHVRIHDLRHTAVSMWLASGVGPKEVATRAGHTSVATVLDRYGHLIPGADATGLDVLDQFAADAFRAAKSTRSAR